MPRLLLPAAFVMALAACSPPPAAPAPPAPAASPAASTEPVPVTTTAEAASVPAAEPPTEPVASAPAGSAIEGAIREGNRPPPALRVCAHPLDGGKPTCIETAAGAATYRIEVAAGRYVVVGIAKDDPGMQFAHAERIRCLRAPCPPDTAIVVEVADGETTSGIGLTAGNVQQPDVE